MKQILTLVLVIVALSSFATAQESEFVRSGSIGTQPSESESCPTEPMSYLPARCWEGQRVMFLPQPKNLRKYGWQDVEPRGIKKKPGVNYNPPHDELAGKTAVITKLVTTESSSGLFTFHSILLEGESTAHEQYVMRVTVNGPHGDGARDIVLLSDLIDARTRWKDKSIWLKRDYLETYDETTGEFPRATVPRLSKLLVTDIAAGWSVSEPVRLIVKTDTGQEGFVSVCVSGTFTWSKLCDYHRPDVLFFEHDPKTLFTWPDAVWEAVAESRVFLGMTEEQATLAWGRPSKVNRDVDAAGESQQWVYEAGPSYLYFRNGELASIQN